MRVLHGYITDIMKNSGAITKENEAVVVYGLKGMLIMLINTLSVLLVGFFMGVLVHIGFLLINFAIIRSFTGGYHAKSEMRCFILSNIFIAIAGFFITKISMVDTITIVIYLIANILIVTLSPLDDEVRKTTPNEKKRYRKIIVGVIVIQMVALLLPLGEKFKVALMFSNYLVSLLLVIGWMRLKIVRL